LNNSTIRFLIPLDNIKQWLDRTAIVASDSIENTPYILGTADQRVLAGKGQNVYVRGQGLTSVNAMRSIVKANLMC
jgi:hypothetical protein